MSVVMIVNGQLNPNEKEALSSYVTQSTPLFAQAGGKLVSRHQVTEAVVGEYSINLVVMMKFDSAEAVRSVFDSQAYQALIPLRDKGFTQLNVFIGQE